MSTRDFHIGDILSITTERLVSLRHIDGVYDILNFMTGQNLFTHQLPRASREMSPRLLAQHPQLTDVDADGVSADNWKEWLEEQVSRFGKTLPVKAEHQFHKAINPITEAEEMMAKKKNQNT